MQEYWLDRSTPQQLRISPACSWACHCGVFESEERFIEYLRAYQAPNYGPCKYMGIRENPRDVPLIIGCGNGGQRNFSISEKSSSIDRSK